MKLNLQLILAISACIIVSVFVLSYVALKSTEDSLLSSKIADMQNSINVRSTAIDDLHNRVHSEMIFAMQNPLFVKYFDLPETKAGNVYKNGVMQFTANQREVKTQLEHLIYSFQNQFQVSETCIIDRTGEEHARLVQTKIAPDEDLSPSESGSSFFDASFKVDKGQMHIQYPYLSPDTKEWVFAYTSPVVLDDGQKPAFYHFEMPVRIFDDLVKSNVPVGRMFVLDPSGFLVADSVYSFPKQGDSEDAAKYFPSSGIISESTEFGKITKEMVTGNAGHATYENNGEIHYVVYRPLNNFGWSIGYDIPYSQMLSGATSLDGLKTNIIILALIITVASMGVLVVLTRKIMRPINYLTTATNVINKISDGDLTIRLENTNSKSEVGTLIQSINNMIHKLTPIVKSVRDGTVSLSDASQRSSAATEELTAGISEISMVMTQITAGSKDQSQKLDNSSNAIEQISKETTDLANAVNESVVLTDKVGALSERGSNSAQDAGDRMNKIIQVTNESARKVRGLADKTKDITSVLDTIRQIADQTNLLALNAAIEAARAGEAGRGFAVVADEVRRLAENSARSADEIDTQLGQIQIDANTVVTEIEQNENEINEGKKVIDSALGSLSEIATHVKGVSTTVKALSKITESQVVKIKTVADNAEEVTNIAQNTVSGSEQALTTIQQQTAASNEIAQTSQEVARMAEELSMKVDFFKISDGSVKLSEEEIVDDSKADLPKKKSLIHQIIPIKK